MQVKVTIFPDDEAIGNDRWLSLHRIIPNKDFETARTDIAQLIADAMACELLLAKKCRDQKEPR